MNVKELKKLLAELPEECDELPVFAYADHAQHYESVYSPTVVWISDDYDYSVDSKEEANEYGYTIKAVIL